jgi:hypothetical protein
MKTAIEMIAEERERQQSEEGWTADHDDTNADGQLAYAAFVYARHAGLLQNAPHDVYVSRAGGPPFEWPWSAEWWKPKSPISDLVRAGALIAAEIERLMRRGGQ